VAESATLTTLISDLDALASAYERAGLIDQHTLHGPAALLVGGRDDVNALRRQMFMADALLRNVLARKESDRPRHVCVFGGTQVGKSTMANVLLARNAARVHHTAGFTRHAQAFAPEELLPKIFCGFPHAFRGFKRVAQDHLSSDKPHEYSVSAVAAPGIPATIVWDAPDCDSVESSRYDRALVEVLTLADVAVYVTSKEKYAVRAVLEWVATVLETGVPVVAVRNMTPASQQPDLLASMDDALARVREAHGISRTPKSAVAFEYVADGEVGVLFDLAHETAGRLRRSVGDVLDGAPPRRRNDALRYLRGHIDAIIAPAMAEIEAQRTWAADLKQALDGFVDNYRAAYLDDPNRYDAFNMVAVEILALLEPPIPGLKEAISYTRRILTLPAQLILTTGRMVWRLFSGRGRRRDGALPNEVLAYKESHEQLLNTLARMIARRRAEPRHHPFWDALDRQWDNRIAAVHVDFQRGLNEHRKRGEEWIRETAEGIYNEIKRDPIKLNFLRTSRLAGDVAAIVIAIKTGGAGDLLHDLLLAPALMAMVEMLSQQLSATYVEQRKRELRERLLADTREFATNVYGKQLEALGASAIEASGFVDLDPEAVESLPRRVEELARELKIPLEENDADAAG
jgi:hypothetical protein